MYPFFACRHETGEIPDSFICSVRNDAKEKKKRKEVTFLSKKCYYRLFLFVLLVVDLFAAGYLGLAHLKNSLPDTVYLRRGTQDSLENILDLPMVSYPETIDVSDNGSYRLPCFFLGIIPLKEVEVKTVEDKWVSVCGKPIGLYMETQGVLIVDTGEITVPGGQVVEPALNIARAGDYILEADGEKVSGKKDLIERIEESSGEPVQLLVNREGENIPISINPVMSSDGSYKLGIWVRDNTQGIGTMTYVDQEGKFGALGHGISDTDTGELLDVEGGELYEAQIVSVVKGTKGTPGELSGYIDYQESKKIGLIDRNTEIGIFGTISDTAKNKLPLSLTEVGYKQEVIPGKAEIVTELDGEVGTYEIEITEIYMDRADTNKAFEICVTDPELLAKTGGIVQGMSGSPILQNGKLIGAVTHVFVQDSTKGYGIFIENMLW